MGLRPRGNSCSFNPYANPSLRNALVRAILGIDEPSTGEQHPIAEFVGILAGEGEIRLNGIGN